MKHRPLVAAVLLLLCGAGFVTAVCPADWKSVSTSSGTLCLRYFKEEVTHREAKLKCWQLKGNLAMPKTKELNGIMDDYLIPRRDKTFWLGLDDWQHETVHVWADGTYLENWRNWGPGGPKNWGVSHCTAMWWKSLWLDRSCSEKRAFLCQLNPRAAEVDEDTTGVMDMDGKMKSCPAYIALYGNFMCAESIVRRLCRKTCKALKDWTKAEVKYPEKLILDLYIAADQKAFESFRLYMAYQQSIEAARIKMRKHITDDLKIVQKYFDKDLDTPMRIVRVDILDINFNQTYEDGSYARSQGLMENFKNWYIEKGVFKELKFDLSCLITGYGFRDGWDALDPGNNSPTGRASQGGVCRERYTSVIRYMTSPPLYNYGLAHELGHVLNLAHMTGGIMYGKTKTGCAFIDTQREKVIGYLRPYWNGDRANDKPRSRVLAMKGNIQKSFIGTNCLRHINPKPVNLNTILSGTAKNPDRLCKNAFGIKSSYCRYSAYYGMQVPTGDAICNNLHCVIGEHTECLLIDNVNASTEGMTCASGRTCQAGRCRPTPGKQLRRAICPVGRFGDFCKKRCHCKDPRTPCVSRGRLVCRQGCANGWTGTACDKPECPEGWTGLASSGKCYKIVKNKWLGYRESNLECKQIGGTSLALAKTPEINSLLNTLRRNAFGKRLVHSWIGLDCLETRPNYRWLDGSFPVWDNYLREESSRAVIIDKDDGTQRIGPQYSRDEPYNWNNLRNCSFMRNRDWSWVTSVCQSKQHFFCEMDNVHMDCEPNTFDLCPYYGDQKYVTVKPFSGGPTLKQSISCADVVAKFGVAACFGNFPVQGMKDVCCQTCSKHNATAIAIGQNTNAGAFDVFGSGRKEWTLVFRGSSGVGQSAYDAYLNHQTGDVAAGCRQMSPSVPCRSHYRNNDALDYWAGVDQVAFVLYKDGVRVAHLLFDGRGSDVTNWFSESRINGSTFKDLTGQRKNYFGIRGNYNYHWKNYRRFFISHSYGGCHDDWGWVVVVDNPNNQKPDCAWERKNNATYPRILYAHNGKKSNMNTLAEADAFGVFVKYRKADCATCRYKEEGSLQRVGKARETCAQFLQTSAAGSQACRDMDFWTFCCHSCSKRAAAPRLEQCKYGPVNYIDALNDLTCADVLAERGPGMCAVTTGFNLPKPFAQLCCDHCKQNKAEGCEYDDGLVKHTDMYMRCSDYTSQFGFTKCGEEVFSEICCKTCRRHMVAMQEKKCDSDWKYAFAIDTCYLENMFERGKQRKTFADARAFCATKGGMIPLPRNPRENRFWFKTGKSKDQWYGLTSVKVGDATFEWQPLGGDRLSWSDWIFASKPVDGKCVYATDAGWARTDCEGRHAGQKFFTCVKMDQALQYAKDNAENLQPSTMMLVMVIWTCLFLSP